LRNGIWRAAVVRKDGVEIPFNFEVRDSLGRKVLEIRNADERLVVDSFVVQGDSLLIRLPFFEAQFRTAFTSDGNLEGVYMKRGASNFQVMDFKATYGDSSRFHSGGITGITSVGGRWRAVFRDTSGKDTTFRIGEFRQRGDQVTGTFLDAGGDLRYLEGVVDGNQLKLSTFDGGHAYYFTAKKEGDHYLVDGKYYAGATHRETWAGVKDADARLPDEYTITRWKKDVPFDFTFRDLDGKPVSLHDDRFRGKIVLVQIMGSWCPNCMDETRFLSGLYDEYRPKGIEIIALAYERSTDFARSVNSVRSFQKRFNVKYPMLITGVAVGDSLRTQKTLPQLEDIVNFPTTIFVGKDGKIKKIHTGFNGPGTGEHYEEQKKEFREIADNMLRE
jgi:thiol-disulfide isomerase/thioredoxin